MADSWTVHWKYKRSSPRAGTIIYKPTCSECGAVIVGEVYGVRYESLAMINRFTAEYEIGIHPEKCWKCGSQFYSIVKDVNDIQVVSE